MSKSVFLKVSSAFLVGGQLAKAGEVVEVTNTEAKDLLSRGKATLAVVEGGQRDEAETDQSGTEQTQGENANAAQAPAKPAKPAKSGKKGK